MLTIMPAHLPGARIDIDKHDAPVANEFQAIGHRFGVVFRPQILHAAHRRQDLAFDVAQGMDVARAQVAPRFVLFIMRRPGACNRRDREGQRRKRAKKGQSNPMHHTLLIPMKH